MSSGNHQFERKQNYELRKKTVTGTHTVQTGLASQGWKFENPIDVGDPADDFTLTVGSGVYMGQILLIVMSSNASSKTCSISVTNHETSDPEVFTMDAADEYLLLIWTGTEWATVSTTCTT